MGGELREAKLDATLTLLALWRAVLNEVTLAAATSMDLCFDDELSTVRQVCEQDNK